MAEKRAWDRIQARIPDAERIGITIRDVHAVDAETDRPLTRIVTMEQYANFLSGSGSSNYKCLLCMKIGCLPNMRVSEARVIDHVSQV